MMSAAPRQRRCVVCSRVSPEAELVLLGVSESRPGWCGGPRQGGRPSYAHPACRDASQAQNEASAAAYAARVEAARAYVAECKATGVDVDLDRWDELLNG